jgi:asparagine synthase (glutamine-hydrolysing)
MPPNWHCNPLTGQSVPADRHWTQISDFDTGDIKYIWEASRFSIVYTLVRAFAATHDPKYALAFWELVENWAKHNPPQRGPNWKCGQEASFRVMAWCFGLYAFIDHTTPERVAQFVAMIAAHGERIERNIDYARSQNNNHGISEGVGLWTIGILFPELRSAKRWTALGKQVIESEIRRQVYADGSYAQYSPNYQRVMLHDVIWALRLGELNNNHFSPDIYQKVAISTNFLLGILDPESGRVPNHGANDSALVLPLNSASPDDFRPVIQTAYYLVNKKRLSTEGDEDIFWLFGKDALSSPLDHPVSDCQKLSANIGGYYTLRGDDSWLMVRCARYRARPHHADQLHVDFWWRGINICCDAGTYLYNGDSPWQNGLVTTAVHNTVTVDDQDQMTHFGHFLWLDWSQGIVHHHEETYWEGSHNGYRRLNPPVTHRRSIQRLDDVWIIADELQSTGNHRYCLHWLIPTLPYRLIDNTIILDPPAGHFFVYCSHPPTYKTREHDHVAGWRSLTYGHKEPALSFYITTSDEKYARFWTILSPKPLTIDRHNHPNIVLINGTEVKLFRLSFQADL